LLDRTTSPQYIYLYFNAIDATCHTYGPESAQLHAEIDTLLSTMERVLMPLLSQSKRRTLMLLTADHGQTAVDPHSTLYLNRDPAFADLHRYVRTDARGNLLIPAGSPRDMFVYIKDGLVDEAQAYLSERLVGRAHVLQVNDLLTTGMFGPEPISSVFRARAGDLVILPFDNETIWWYEQDRFEQTFWGHHGGLTPQEMEIPLLLYPAGC
jgi:predicted AlkP superfamily pyrophosphatase or phosphodiesterase